MTHEIKDKDEIRLEDLKKDIASLSETEREIAWSEIWQIMQKHITEQKAKLWGLGNIQSKQTTSFIELGSSSDKGIKENLTSKEMERLELIKKEGKLIASELSKLTNSNKQNLESVYLNKIARKGYIGRIRRGKSSYYMLLENAVREIAKTNFSGRENEFLNEDIARSIANEVGSTNIIDIKKTLTDLYREKQKES